MKNYLLCIFLAVFTISIYGQNHKNAADYRTDAINGNAIAQFYLGQSYFRGWGIKPDTIQAVYWWRKSAEQGNPAAQNNMGAAYSNGWGNLTQNKETAIYWYKNVVLPEGAVIEVEEFTVEIVPSQGIVSEDYLAFYSNM